MHVLQGLPPHLVCSDYSQVCVLNGVEILSCLSLFILAKCLVSSLSRTDTLVPTKEAKRIYHCIWDVPQPRKAVPTTCHFLAAPLYPHTQSAHNWKPPASVTFKSCMKNDWLAKSNFTWQLSSEALSEPGCDSWASRSLGKRSNHRVPRHHRPPYFIDSGVRLEMAVMAPAQEFLWRNLRVMLWLEKGVSRLVLMINLSRKHSLKLDYLLGWLVGAAGNNGVGCEQTPMICTDVQIIGSYLSMPFPCFVPYPRDQSLKMTFFRLSFPLASRWMRGSGRRVEMKRTGEAREQHLKSISSVAPAHAGQYLPWFQLPLCGIAQG